MNCYHHIIIISHWFTTSIFWGIYTKYHTDNSKNGKFYLWQWELSYIQILLTLYSVTTLADDNAISSVTNVRKMKSMAIIVSRRHQVKNYWHIHITIATSNTGDHGNKGNNGNLSNHSSHKCTRWFQYDRDWSCVNKSQFVPVIFEPPCM